MLKIGEFSKLSEVTVKTLHHYDEMGLLKPVQIDPSTKYRYYSVNQLPRVHRIMALKELGLSLEQIGQMLHSDVSTEQIRGMLRLKQAESQQRIRDEQERLQRIEFRLQMIDIEDEIPALDVVIKETSPLYALTLRRSVKPQNMVALGLDVEKVLADHQIELTGPVMEIRFEEEFTPVHEDVMFVWPVSDKHTKPITLTTFGVLQPMLLESLPMVASYMVRGLNPTSIRNTMSIFRRWIIDNNYHLCPRHRVVFHLGPTEHAEYDDWIIEFQHEIRLAEDHET